MRLLPLALALTLLTFGTAAQTVGGAPRPLVPHEINAWSMFMDADPVVKGVMIGLAVASLATWTIFFAKTLVLWFTRRRLAASLGRLANARTLAEAYEVLKRKRGPAYDLLQAASEEARLSRPTASPNDVSGRAMSRLVEVARAETRAVRHGMSALATIGSTAPFVGLFGTVWGIMNSFIGITRLQTTNLAVVAPGIAEALLATACGLVAAIPAVVIYNFLARQIRVYGDLVNDASGAVARLLSRSVESGEAPFGGADRG
jgi:biopolymer transport protein ExbB